jgi:hypothetical protein
MRKQELCSKALSSLKTVFERLELQRQKNKWNLRFRNLTAEKFYKNLFPFVQVERFEFDSVKLKRLSMVKFIKY